MKYYRLVVCRKIRRFEHNVRVKVDERSKDNCDERLKDKKDG
jgi:hypothetical protein